MFRLAEDREIVLYCDFHGHSKKQNVFIYGCDVMDNPRTRLKSRVFPRMLSKNAPAMFSFKDSKFSVHKSKVAQSYSLCITSFLIQSQYNNMFMIVIRFAESVSSFSVNKTAFCMLYILESTSLGGNGTSGDVARDGRVQ